MRALIKLEYCKYQDKLSVYRSIKLKDKRDSYEAHFKFDNGYVLEEKCIMKKQLRKPISLYPTLIYVMYLADTAYDRNPEQWHSMLETFARSG